MPPLCRETQSLGQQMLKEPLGINGLRLCCVSKGLFTLSLFSARLMIVTGKFRLPIGQLCREYKEYFMHYSIDAADIAT